eukprot:TRINITY_DN9205_c0_g1_i1.p1 TRINITY_DN9205_c0_g1~~TRINITY_DN9205_c0_g1_i1.p1  ORF type:complete len:546 (+),score=145.04 TRINITY_DN9205_c0_g1_i1:125-1762(+)
MFGQGTSSLGDYEVLSKLGQGSYSSVLKKVKLDKLNERERQNSLNEVRILASVTSPYIVGYKEAFFDEATHSLCVVMEFVDGGDLLQKIREHSTRKTWFEEDDVWAYAIQMLKGLKTLHDMGILHRDLKCANIFVARERRIIKVGDLNVAKVAKNGFLSTQTGTPYYASPEVWRDESYNAKSDIWSLGCVLYEMLALKPPFRAPDMEGLFRKVQKGVYERIPTRYSQELADFVGLCLTLNPANRPMCDELLELQLVRRRIELDPHLEMLGDCDVGNQELLSTIKFPKNIKQLASLLPRPKPPMGIRSMATIEESPENEGKSGRGVSSEGKRSHSTTTLPKKPECVSSAKKPSRLPRAPDVLRREEMKSSRDREEVRSAKRSRTPPPCLRESPDASGRASRCKDKLTPILAIPLIPAAINPPEIKRRRGNDENFNLSKLPGYLNRQSTNDPLSRKSSLSGVLDVSGISSRQRSIHDRSEVMCQRSINSIQDSNSSSILPSSQRYERIYALLAEGKQSAAPAPNAKPYYREASPGVYRSAILEPYKM